jgi:phosphomannomutase
MTKKLIAFDLDDTLAVTKSPISDRMAEILSNLLDRYDICIISGGKIDQFHNQVVDRLDISDDKMARLHLMPTCGTRYYKYHLDASRWHQEYAEDLSKMEKKHIIEVIELTAKELGLWAEDPYGEIIEDRGSQVTYSALGQQAPADVKYAWSKENQEQKKVLRSLIAERLQHFEVRLGGSTSVDITRIGIDKAYGMQKLIDALSLDKDEILFLGDKLQEGGNDYPVKAMGIDSIEVDRWEDTAFVLEGILAI